MSSSINSSKSQINVKNVLASWSEEKINASLDESWKKLEQIRKLIPKEGMPSSNLESMNIDSIKNNPLVKFLQINIDDFLCKEEPKPIKFKRKINNKAQI